MKRLELLVHTIGKWNLFENILLIFTSFWFISCILVYSTKDNKELSDIFNLKWFFAISLTTIIVKAHRNFTHKKLNKLHEWVANMTNSFILI